MTKCFCGRKLPNTLDYLLTHNTYTCPCGQQFTLRPSVALQMVRTFAGVHEEEPESEVAGR